MHKTKSFCGHSLYVSVRGAAFKREDVVLLGEFRNTRVHPSFSENQVLESIDFGETYTEGVLLRQENNVMSFAINPVRKWQFDGKLRPMDHYVFTVFLIVCRKVVAIKDSPAFSIIPIWKAPGGENGKEVEEEEEPESGVVAPKLSKKRSRTTSTPTKRFPSETSSSTIPMPSPALVHPPPPPQTYQVPPSLQSQFHIPLFELPNMFNPYLTNSYASSGVSFPQLPSQQQQQQQPWAMRLPHSQLPFVTSSAGNTTYPIQQYMFSSSMPGAAATAPTGQSHIFDQQPGASTMMYRPPAAGNRGQ
jgi:hypothetical protein